MLVNVKMMNSERILLPLPPAIKSEIRKVATAEGETVTAYLRELIRKDLRQRGHTISLMIKAV
jgi:hypothetical protein